MMRSLLAQSKATEQASQHARRRLGNVPVISCRLSDRSKKQESTHSGKLQAFITPIIPIYLRFELEYLLPMPLLIMSH
jgi:hypothetical protein